LQCGLTLGTAEDHGLLTIRTGEVRTFRSLVAKALLPFRLREADFRALWHFLADPMPLLFDQCGFFDDRAEYAARLEPA
jgi:hypothetical protein